MIVDTTITYRADFVPRRGRIVRKGFNAETVPVTIREIRAEEAPVAFNTGRDYWKKAVRVVDGLLYSSITDARTAEPAIDEVLSKLVETWSWRTGLRPNVERTLAMADDAVPVTTHRELAVASLQSFLNQELLYVDGCLHQRRTSPLIPVSNYIDAYGRGAARIRDETGCDFMPTFFPPQIEGQRLLAWANGLEGRPAVRGDAKGWMLEIGERMTLEVVDPKLQAEVARDPRNWSMAPFVREGIDSLRRLGKIEYVHPAGAIWFEMILEIMVAAEAAAGTPIPDIQRLVAELAKPTSKAEQSEVFFPAKAAATRNIVVTVNPIEREKLPTGRHEAEVPVVHGPLGESVLKMTHFEIFAKDGEFFVGPVYPHQLPNTDNESIILDKYRSIINKLSGYPGVATPVYNGPGRNGIVDTLRKSDEWSSIAGIDYSDFVRHRMVLNGKQFLLRCPEPLVAVQLSDEAATVTASLSWALLAVPGDNPPFLFHADQTEAPMDLASAARPKRVMIHSTPSFVGVVPHVFDTEAWNLKVALNALVANSDSRIGLLPKENLDAFLRIVAHLRDWRIDSRLVAGSEQEMQFVRDAGVLMSDLGGQIFDDVGPEWLRDIAKTSYAVVAGRHPEETPYADDEALKDFGF